MSSAIQPLIVRHRVGGWLPRDHRVLQRWIDKKLKQLEQRKKAAGAAYAYKPVIEEFKSFIEGDAVIFMLFHQMFDQVPTKPPYDQDPTLKPQIRDYITLLDFLDMIIGEAPEFQDNDLVGFPINAVLDWPMGTPGGQAAFGDPRVNVHFKKMFDVWAAFLTSADSRYVLTKEDNGWFGPAASEQMPNFIETFKCDPDAPYYGFTSWDDFFTREFRDGKRPVELPEDNNIINSACESEVYCIASDIKATDSFWLKGEPYSLDHMLNYDEYASQFVGGTIYQAFLSALNYHRWHSPVNGTIVKVVQVPGTYYLESPAMGFFNPEGPDPAGPNLSQAFITAMAARALIFIQADNPAIGLMCMVTVGMAEVSTNEVTVKEGTRVYKGDQIGMFHFGGSTHCLIFRPGVNVTFTPEAQVGQFVQLNKAIGYIQT